MLDKLFKNSSEKLQKLLKYLFAITTCGGMLCFFITFLSGFLKSIKYHQTGNVIIDFILMFVVPVVFAFMNYCGYLFFNMILDFFTDIHDIKKSLKKE